MGKPAFQRRLRSLSRLEPGLSRSGLAGFPTAGWFSSPLSGWAGAKRGNSGETGRRRDRWSGMRWLQFANKAGFTCASLRERGIHSALAGRLATWRNKFRVPTQDELTYFIRASFGLNPLIPRSQPAPPPLASGGGAGVERGTTAFTSKEAAVLQHGKCLDCLGVWEWGGWEFESWERGRDSSGLLCGGVIRNGNPPSEVGDRGSPFVTSSAAVPNHGRACAFRSWGVAGEKGPLRAILRV